MLDLLGLFALALGLSLLLTPLFRELARRCDLVDHPDTHRKLHGRIIPTVGGPPLLLAVAAVIGSALWWHGVGAGVQTWNLLGLLAGGLIICAVGVADDFGLLRGRHKLMGQLAAALTVVAFGVRVDHVALFGWQIDLGLTAVPFTLFFLLGAINSLNLLDGMDGLLSSVGLVLCLALGAMAFLGGQTTTAWVALTLAGALAGFLFYNFPPASVFLGDSGSMLIGLTAGVLAIQSSLKGPASVALAAPAALLTLPIFDTLAAILRRKLTGRSIYCTDHGHLHHCLQRRGLKGRTILLLVASLGAVTTAGALGSVAFNNEWLALVSGAAVVAVLVATRLFGHAELALAARRTGGLLVSLARGPARGRPRETETRLLGRLDWKELWQGLVKHAYELDLKRVRLNVNAPALSEGYYASWDVTREEGEMADLWRVEFPLSVGGQVIGDVVVVGGRDGRPIFEKLTAVTELLQEFERTARRMAGSAGAAHPDEEAVASRSAVVAVARHEVTGTPFIEALRPPPQPHVEVLYAD
jgi:UDP-GlcNAc:undecaprenyl-phosphate GlcNAc-1-phosphate transferase